MNVKEYIASGIVESYVLGLASDDERREFEQLCARYPELVEARNHFELLLEKQALENAEEPPAKSRSAIWSAIKDSETASTVKVIPIEPERSRSSSGIKWLAAASIILMLVAGYFAYEFYSKNKELQTANGNMDAKIKSMDSVINQMKEELTIMKNPKNRVIQMTSLKGPNRSTADVYWDSTSTSVYLLVKNMPQLASDKQYQLWYLLDGKPTSLGLFDGDKPQVMLKMEMENAKKADAFAITIEPRGNTGPPHLEDLQVMGKTKL